MKQNHRDFIREAGQEASTLLMDGYRLTANWSDSSSKTIHFFMRHALNGARIHIKVQSVGYQIIRNGIIVKEVSNGVK